MNDLSLIGQTKGALYYLQGAFCLLKGGEHASIHVAVGKVRHHDLR
jgi:hypothetical protein